MRALVVIVCLTAVFAGCHPRFAPDDPVQSTRYLDQGNEWESMRDQFHYTPQGSLLVPYEWFVSVEQPGIGEQPLFNNADAIEGYRYLTSDTPGGLPIGFTKDPASGYLGLTCAACHTTQINYNGVGIRIDGAPTMGDIQYLLVNFYEALALTLAEHGKFERFAVRVLGEGASLEARYKLWDSMVKYLVPVVHGLLPSNSAEVARSATPTNEDEFKRLFESGEHEIGFLKMAIDGFNTPKVRTYGFGRLDALGGLMNAILSTDMDIKANAQPADAPVSYPFLWGTPELDWVEWNGAVMNPLVRNIGEVLGVFAQADLHTQEHLFDSTIIVENLIWLEDAVKMIEPPKWQSDVIGELDAKRVARGKALYEKDCVSCHSLPPYPTITRKDTNGNDHQFVKTVMVALDEIGTDPKMASNFGNRTGQTGLLKPYLDGKDVAPALALLVAATQGVRDTAAAKLPPPGLSEATLAAAQNYSPNSIEGQTPASMFVYKARPLAGIWATAPYLHNGSVPNLYQLLLPSVDRDTTFYLGSRQFDPKNVGFDTSREKGLWQFDTSLEGNRNTGHEYGTSLSDSQRWDLVEFLKTL
ncbi:MAG: di-heme-cytochrome C peroxidase [Candidatus Poribacteria bacterium]|nr:di-heme-cytochrome C peroxidase [Candidatus Poribacteria bacterium]